MKQKKRWGRNEVGRRKRENEEMGEQKVGKGERVKGFTGNKREGRHRGRGSDRIIRRGGKVKRRGR